MRILSFQQFISNSEEVHGKKYSYSDYTNSRSKVHITCPFHGEFLQKANNHLRGAGCPKCKMNRIIASRRIPFSTIIQRANSQHSDKYDYSKIDYKNSRDPVPIICKIHGMFMQNMDSHLKGAGCPLCSLENQGWNYTKWENLGKQSKYFVAYQVYIVKCWKGSESFYKIGKTFKAVSHRFRGKQFPYNFKIIKVIEGTALEMSKLEVTLKNLNFENSYVPKLFFAGRTECFNQVNF